MNIENSDFETDLDLDLSDNSISNNLSNKIPPNKFIKFIKNISPYLNKDTYKERFSLLDERENKQLIISLDEEVEDSIEDKIFDLNDVFLNHTKINVSTNPYSAQKKVKSNIKRDDRLSKRFEIEFLFHTDIKYHEEFKIKLLKNRHGAFQKKDVDNSINYLYDIFKVRRTEYANKCILVEGNIGSGKSTFVANLAYKFIKDNLRASKSTPKNFVKINPVFIDVEKVLDNIALDKDINKLYNEIIKNTLFQVNIVCKTKYISLNDVEINKNVILIFDNIDFIYHTFCKKLYGRNANYKNMDISRENYFKLINKLFIDFSIRKYADLGLINFFVSRTDTKKLLTFETDNIGTGESISRNFQYIIEIGRPSNEYVNNVIQKRLELVKTIFKKRKYKTNYLQVIENNITKIKNSDFSTYNSITTYGLRHTMSLLRRLSWTLMDKNLFERYFLDKNILLLYFYLNNRNVYSQITGNIINIFLINTTFRKNNNPIHDNQPLYSNKLLSDHLHTYWLKYFLVEYIKSENASVEKVINKFAKVETKVHIYEKSIVELCLLSLSEMEHGRLIKNDLQPVQYGSINSNGLKTTNKTNFMLDNNIFFSLFYLLAIIEDLYMEYPNIVIENMQIKSDFEFLYEIETKDFTKKLNKSLIERVPKIFMFLDILSISLDEELKKCSDVYTDDFFKKIIKPNFVKIRKNIEKEFKPYKDKFSAEELKQFNKNNQEYIDNRQSNNKKLKIFFQEVYYTNMIGKVKKRFFNF